MYVRRRVRTRRWRCINVHRCYNNDAHNSDNHHYNHNNDWADNYQHNNNISLCRPRIRWSINWRPSASFKRDKKVWLPGLHPDC